MRLRIISTKYKANLPVEYLKILKRYHLRSEKIDPLPPIWSFKLKSISQLYSLVSLFQNLPNSSCEGIMLVIDSSIIGDHEPFLLIYDDDEVL